MSEGIVYGLAVACSIAGGWASADVVGVGALRHEGGTTVVGHAGEQVASRFVGLRERHVAGHGKRLQQVSAGQVHVLFTELMEVNHQFLI